MNKKYKDSKLRLHFVILGFIIILTFFLSVGYATLDSITLDISGEVVAIPQSEIFISNVEYSTNINADTEKSIIHQYYQTMLHNTVVLGNTADSSITYTITIYNNSDETYTFNSVEYSPEFYDNPNIVFELEGLNQGDLLLSKQQCVFSIKFYYLDNAPSINNILNSYLNFKFVRKGNLDEIPDINNILINANKIMIYNAEKDKVLIDITNNNNAPVDLKLTIEDNIIDTISIESQQSKSIGKEIKEILGKLQTNKEYEVMIEQVEPYSQKKGTGVKIKVFPTITNYDLGVRTDGNEENPYLIYKIEDLIRLAQKVNCGDSIANTYIKQISNLDFNNQLDYYNSNDTSFGNLNGNNNDNNQILTEMTTGSGFIMIGNSEENSFQGIFDGGDNRIDNIIMNKTDSNVKAGLFSYIKNATIKNLSIFGNYNIVTDGGGLVGGIFGNSTILNCSNNVNIINSVEDFSVGGITGYLAPSSNVLIDNCTNNANITNGSITGCSTTGGLVGFVYDSVLTITNSNNIGTIVSIGIANDWTGTGGLVGKDNSGGAVIILKNSHNSGEISSKGPIDAFVGNKSSNGGKLTIEGCTNTGNIVNGTTVNSAPSNYQQAEPIDDEISSINDNVNENRENKDTSEIVSTNANGITIIE